MARRREAPVRHVMPDTVYGSELVSKFINQVMVSGKKSVAEAIVYGALEILSKEISDVQAVDAFEKVLDNARPLVEVKSRRVGGATYQVPIEVAPPRGRTLAMKWLKSAASSRREKSMFERLGREMVEAYHGRGAAVKKREDAHKMADANKAFAHFRW
jgi:small subunit ribosomal protein S7